MTDLYHKTMNEREHENYTVRIESDNHDFIRAIADLKADDIEIYEEIRKAQGWPAAIGIYLQKPDNLVLLTSLSLNVLQIAKSLNHNERKNTKVAIRVNTISSEIGIALKQLESIVSVTIDEDVDSYGINNACHVKDEP